MPTRLELTTPVPLAAKSVIRQAFIDELRRMRREDMRSAEEALTVAGMQVLGTCCNIEEALRAILPDDGWHGMRMAGFRNAVEREFADHGPAGIAEMFSHYNY